MGDDGLWRPPICSAVWNVGTPSPRPYWPDTTELLDVRTRATWRWAGPTPERPGSRLPCSQPHRQRLHEAGRPGVGDPVVGEGRRVERRWNQFLARRLALCSHSVRPPHPGHHRAAEGAMSALARRRTLM